MEDIDNSDSFIDDEEPAFIFLHIPHTSGRCLRNVLKNLERNGIFRSLHNEKFISKYNDAWGKHKQMMYFILREPIGRTIGEFTHYSNHIKKFGWVNHLNKDIVSEVKDDTDLADPFEYVKLENNKNLYCKFILLREDFSEPVSKADYEKVLEILEQGLCFYDIFSSRLTNLESILERPINMKMKMTNDKKEGTKGIYESDVKIKSSLMGNEELISLIQEENKFDLMLFEILMGSYDKKEVVKKSRHCTGIY